MQLPIQSEINMVANWVGDVKGCDGTNLTGWMTWSGLEKGWVPSALKVGNSNFIIFLLVCFCRSGGDCKGWGYTKLTGLFQRVTKDAKM